MVLLKYAAGTLVLFLASSAAYAETSTTAKTRAGAQSEIEWPAAVLTARVRQLARCISGESTSGLVRWPGDRATDIITTAGIQVRIDPRTKVHISPLRGKTLSSSVDVNAGEANNMAINNGLDDIFVIIDGARFRPRCPQGDNDIFAAMRAEQGSDWRPVQCLRPTFEEVAP